MVFETITTEVDRGLALIRFNRPAAYNALNMKMVEELNTTLADINQDDTIRAVMFSGTGKAFHSGGDIKYFVERGDDLPQDMEEMLTGFHAFISRLVRLKKPLLAAVNGPAAGAGFSLAMACDVVLAHENALFSLAYTSIGASPDGGSTFFLARLLGVRRALELALTPRTLSAAEALDLSLVTQVLPDAGFMEAATNFGLKLAQGPTQAFARTRDLLYHSLNNQLETQLELESRAIVASARTDDFKEGICAFVEKRAPRFSGK